MKRLAAIFVVLLGTASSAQAQHFYAHRQPGFAASSNALPNPGLPAGVPPAYVNTPPSRAALLQNAYSAEFLDRAREAERPSPAQRLQEKEFRERRHHRR